MRKDFLKGRTAIVTGATGGIGQSICTKLASYGMNVVAVGRNKEKLNEISVKIEGYGGTPLAVPGDITDMEFVEKLPALVKERFEGFDILVNCAGIAQRDEFEEVTVEKYDMIMNTNVRAPYFLCQKSLPYLRESDCAAIINIASVVAHKGYPLQSVYAASKHALLGWSKSLANEVYEEDIRVHVIAPGGVYTDMVGLSRPDLSREGMPVPEDVADTVGFLLEMRHTNAVFDELEFHRKNKAPFV